MSGVVERLVGLRLLDPWLLAAILLVPAALLLGLKGGAPTLRFAPAWLFRRERTDGASPRVPRSWRVVLAWVPRTLVVTGLLLLALALARPAYREPLPLRTEGIDVLLCLDTSSSMTANDLDPRRTRLEVARDAATTFIRGRPDDRIGLVTFARFPDLRCPLTRDHDALTEILAEVTTVESDGSEDATGIGAAVARAAQVLDGSASTSRVVILLTDGEENVAMAGAVGEIPPAHAAQLCQRLGVKVYAIAAGIGRREPGGRWVKLDTRPVRLLAERTGGVFHEVRDAGALQDVYERIDRLEKAPVEEPRYVFVALFLPFLLVGIALLLLGRLLAATVWDVLP